MVAEKIIMKKEMPAEKIIMKKDMVVEKTRTRRTR